VVVVGGKGGEISGFCSLIPPPHRTDRAALHDGRVGFTFLHSMDPGTGRGRNAVYVAMDKRIARLQPVPVERQVEEMVSRGLIVPACELLMGTCPDDDILAAKLDRLHLDAGRMLFLGLHFEMAFAHLSVSSLDPRELIGMFRSLVLSTDGVRAAEEGGPDAVPLETVIRAFCYPPVVFNRDVTTRVVGGTARPADLVGDSHDAMVSPADIGNYNATRLVYDDASGGSDGASGVGRGPAPGVEGVAAEVGELVKAGIATFAAAPPPEGSPLSSMSSTQQAEARTEAGRLTALHEGMLKFLRGRRARIYNALRGYAAHARATAAAAAAAGATSTPGSGAAGGSGASGGAAGDDHRGPAMSSEDRKSAMRFSTHWDEFGRRMRAAPLGELFALALAVDTAIMRLLHLTKRYHTLDRFVFTRSSALCLADAAAFLRGREQWHTLALLYAGRGKVPEAMAYWFELSRSSDEAGAGSPSRLAAVTAAASKHPCAGLVASLAGIKPGASGPLVEYAARNDASFKSLTGASASHPRMGSGGAGGAARQRVDSLSDDDASRLAASGGGGGGTGAGERPGGDGEELVASASAGHGPDAVTVDDEEDAAPPDEFGTVLYTGLGGPRTARRAQVTVDAARRYPPSFFHVADAIANPAAVVRYTGIEDAIAFLRREPDSATVFRYAEWLLLLKPADALTIFTAPLVTSARGRPAPQHHNPDQVLQYLRRPLLVQAAESSASAAVTRLYLEHLVYDRKTDVSTYHTALARQYVDCVLKYDRNSGQPPLFAALPAGPLSLPSGGRTAEAMELAAVERRRGTHRQRMQPGEEPGMVGTFRALLLRLLQDSPHLDAHELLKALQDTSLWEEKVVLHARLGDHCAALDLVVNDLADYATAVHYCLLQSSTAAGNRDGPWVRPSAAETAATAASVAAVAATGRSAIASPAGPAGRPGGGGSLHEGLLEREDEDADADVDADGGGGLPVLSSRQRAQPFLVLLHLFLRAEISGGMGGLLGGSDDGSEPRLTPWDSAVQLLTDYAHAFSSTDVARLLPPTLPLHKVARFWEIAAPLSTHVGKEAAMVAGLYRHVHISAHDGLVEAQSRHVMMTRTTFCAVCDKRMGDAVFAVLPSNRPVHFKCLQEMGGGPAGGSSALLITSTAAADAPDTVEGHGARRLGYAPSCYANADLPALLPSEVNPSTGFKLDTKAALRASVANASPGFLPLYELPAPPDRRRYATVLPPTPQLANASNKVRATLVRRSMRLSRGVAGLDSAAAVTVAGDGGGLSSGSESVAAMLASVASTSAAGARTLPPDAVAAIKPIRWGAGSGVGGVSASGGGGGRVPPSAAPPLMAVPMAVGR